MCNPASLVLTKDKVFWSKTTNSHESIIEEFGLAADGVHGPNILRVEIVPADNYTLPVDEWQFQYDQDILPPWVDAQGDEARARAAMIGWFKYHCCQQSGQHLVGGDMVIQSFNGGDATQTAGKYATQTAGKYATQKGCYRATQTAGICATQKAGGFAIQKAGDCATQAAGCHSIQTAGNLATQNAGSNSTQIAGDCTKQKANVGTVQITRWWSDNGCMCATRIIDKAIANKWFVVERGVWREATQYEIKAAEAKYATPNT